MNEMELTAMIVPEMRIRPAARQLELGKTSKAPEPGMDAAASDADGVLEPALPRRLSVDAIEALQEGSVIEDVHANTGDAPGEDV